MEPNYPILEHEYNSKAMTEPSQIIEPRDVPQCCIISFFKEVNDTVAQEKSAKIAYKNYWEDGPHHIYEIEHHDQRLAFAHPGVGAPVAAGLLEEAIAVGCRQFIVVGGCGVLDKSLTLGKLILVTNAVRDEGVSYHYVEPDREIQANAEAVQTIRAVLDRQEIPFITGKTWTTDAPYRETQHMVNQRKAEGCLTVEMEAASLIAVAQFRKVLLGQILYAGDDLSGDQWDNRGWQSRKEIREKLFWLAADICLEL